MDASTFDNWAGFFAAVAGAAAALLGLLFVGLSLNLTRILEYPWLPARAAETLALLLNVLLIGTFGLVPGQPPTLLGAELLLCSLGAWVFAVVIQVRQRRSGDQHRHWLFRVVACQAATLPCMVAGVSLLFAGRGIGWIVGGVIGAFVASVVNAWVLLVEIQR